MFKGVFFDIDDTIFDYGKCSEEAIINLCKILKIEYKKEYLARYRELDQILWDKQKKGFISVDDVINQRGFEMDKLLSLNKGEFKELLNEELSDSIQFVDGAFEVIQYVYQKDYKIYGASNGFLESQLRRLKKANILEYFADVFVSDDIGFNKPDERFFYEALSRAKLNKEDILMVGDSFRADILGAKNAGIETCFYNPERKNVDIDVMEIYSLQELMNFL